MKQLLVGAMLLSLQGFSQQVQRSFWAASFNTIRLSGKTSLHAEFQLRTTSGASAVQTILPRFGINYHLNSKQVLTAGYAYISNRVSLNDKQEMLGEHRFWQQYILQQSITERIGIQHRLRFEERILPVAGLASGEIEKTGTDFNARFRYFARTILPLTKGKGSFNKGMFAALQEEIFFNAINKDVINGEVFDQNRAYLALGYRLSPLVDLETGYMNQYILRKSTQPNVTNHILQVAMYTRF